MPAAPDSSQLYTLLLSALPDGVIHSHTRGVREADINSPEAGDTVAAVPGETMLAANASACRMLGFVEDELVGRDLADILILDDAGAEPSATDSSDIATNPARPTDTCGRAGTANGNTANLEGQLRRKDGSLLCVDLTRVSTADASGHQHILTIIREAAPRRELEQHAATLARQRNAENLMGGIAHDFNNVLTVILGGAEYLIGGVSDTNEQIQVAESISEAAERGSAITAQLLAYARRQPLSARPVDLNDLIGQLDSLVCSTLGESIEVTMALEPNLPWTRIDSALCGSALLNVLLNARDAMPSGGHLAITTGSYHLPDEQARFPDVNLAPGDYVYVCCRDDGVGMTPQVRERLFEPFFTTKDVGRGTGLGMPMVQSFARQCGGDVSVLSSPDQGTAVTMLFPVLGADAQGDHAHAESLTTADGEIGIGRTVLVVEDNALVLERAVQLLKGLGFTVLSATDGREALRLFNDEGPVDLLFADIVMPGGINGAQLADELSRLQPNLQVLLTTGYWDDDQAGAVSRINDFFILPKPYNGRKLHLALKEVLAHNAARS